MSLCGFESTVIIGDDEEEEEEEEEEEGAAASGMIGRSPNSNFVSARMRPRVSAYALASLYSESAVRATCSYTSAPTIVFAGKCVYMHDMFNIRATCVYAHLALEKYSRRALLGPLWWTA